MAKSLKCAIVGAGVVGAAAAFYLSRRNVDVVVFEQFGLGHERGGSHGETRLFRTAYFEHPNYVPLLLCAKDRWNELSAAYGETLLTTCGVLMAGPATSPVINGTCAAANAHGLEITDVGIDQLQGQLPWFSFPNDFRTIIEPNAGIIFADRAMACFLEGSRSAGAMLYEGARVAAWRSKKKGVILNVDGDWRSFDRVIFAPGSFADAVFRSIGPRIKGRPKSLYWYKLATAQFTLESGFIPFAVETAANEMFYGFPQISDAGVKIGEHTGETDNQEKINEFINAYIPALKNAHARTQECRYAMSPDSHMIIDRMDEDPRIAFAIGLSGHGFKFAPIIGEALADLICGRDLGPEYEFLNADRFR